MAPRRRVSRSWTHVAATKSAGAVTAPNRSCASRRPSESPVHEGRQTTSTNPNAAIIGRRRIARSGFIQRQRSEEHTSELQSQSNLVCRLLLEKKNKHHRHRSSALATQHWPRPLVPQVLGEPDVRAAVSARSRVLHRTAAAVAAAICSTVCACY